MSEVVSTPLNTVLIELLSRTPADRDAWEAQKAQQREQATQLLRQQRLESWLAGLRETATVRDRRNEVLVDPEEQPLRQPGSPFGF